MSWRYQLVFTETRGERSYSIAEVYLDKDGKLTSWTKDPAMSAAGETPVELQRDLVRMLVDAAAWKPVAHKDLTPGMTFEPALPRDARAGLQRTLRLTMGAARLAVKASKKTRRR